MNLRIGTLALSFALIPAALGCGEALDGGDSYVQTEQAEISGPGSNHPAAECGYNQVMVLQNGIYTCRVRVAPSCSLDAFTYIDGDLYGCVGPSIDPPVLQISPTFGLVPSPVDRCVISYSNHPCSIDGSHQVIFNDTVVEVEFLEQYLSAPAYCRNGSTRTSQFGRDYCEDFRDPYCPDGGSLQYFGPHPRCVGGGNGPEEEPGDHFFEVHEIIVDLSAGG